MLTLVLTLAHFFFWVCLGPKMIGKDCLGGDQFLGRLLGQSWGRPEGKSMAFVQEGVQKTQFARNLFYVPVGTKFQSQIDVFWRMFPTIGPCSVAFPMVALLVALLVAFLVALRSLLTQNVPLIRPPCTFLCRKGPVHPPFLCHVPIILVHGQVSK